MRRLVPFFVTFVLSPGAFADPPKGVASWVQSKFRGISQKNGDTRVLHRPGEAYQGTLSAPAGSPLPTSPVTVRLSRGANSPEPKKDFLGLAVRVPTPAGGHDDLLMVSGGKRLPSRSGSFFAKSYSSVLPFRVDGKNYLVRAVPKAQTPGTGTDFDQLHHAVAGGSATFHLELQGLHGTPDRPLGDVTLQRPLSAPESDGLKFQIWNNQVVRPTGVLNGVRRWAYEGSQSTR
jgi:hypothetical protein